MKITGQQYLLLRDIKIGKRKVEDCYTFLSVNINKLPNLGKNFSDMEAVEYFLNNSKVVTEPHKVINWHQSYFEQTGRNRLQNRQILKKAGIIN